MPEPESAPPVEGQPGQTVTPEIYGGVPVDPLAETHSMHADNLSQPASSEVASSGVEPSVTHIDVVEHPNEVSNEEPSATQSMGLPPESPSVDTSLMDKMTEHEPTAGPQEAAGPQSVDVQPRATEPPRPGEENFIQEPEKGEAMAHAGDLNRTLAALSRGQAKEWAEEGEEGMARKDSNLAAINEITADRREAAAGIDYDIKNGLPAPEQSLDAYEKKLMDEIQQHSEALRKAVSRLIEFKETYSKQGQTEPETPQAP